MNSGILSVNINITIRNIKRYHPQTLQHKYIDQISKAFTWGGPRRSGRKICRIRYIFSVWDISMGYMAKWTTQQEWSHWVPGKQVGRGDRRLQGLRCKKVWGEIKRKTSQLTSLFPHGCQPLIPTCVCKRSMGLERQNMIMEKDFDFHCCRLKEFHI